MFHVPGFIDARLFTGLNCRDIFRRRHWYCLSLTAPSFSRHFLQLCLEAKKRISKSTSYTSALDSLVEPGRFGIASVLHHFRATSNCCSLSSSLIGGTSVLEFLQPFFLVTVRPKVAQSQRSYSVLELWIPPDFRLLRRQYGQEIFLRFCLKVTRIWQERKPACNETTRSRKVCVHKWNITPQFALHVTTGGKFN